MPGAGAAIGVLAQLEARKVPPAQRDDLLALIKEYTDKDATAFLQYCEAVSKPQKEKAKAKCSEVPKEFLASLERIYTPTAVKDAVEALVKFNDECNLMRECADIFIYFFLSWSTHSCPVSCLARIQNVVEKERYVEVPPDATEEAVLWALAKRLLQKQCVLLKKNPKHKDLIDQIELQKNISFKEFIQTLDEATTVSALKEIGDVLWLYGPPLAKGECAIARIALDALPL